MPTGPGGVAESAWLRATGHPTGGCPGGAVVCGRRAAEGAGAQPIYAGKYLSLSSFVLPILVKGRGRAALRGNDPGAVMSASSATRHRVSAIGGVRSSGLRGRAQGAAPDHAPAAAEGLRRACDGGTGETASQRRVALQPVSGPRLPWDRGRCSPATGPHGGGLPAVARSPQDTARHRSVVHAYPSPRSCPVPRDPALTGRPPCPVVTWSTPPRRRVAGQQARA
jgi:hypothetical protein